MAFAYFKSRAGCFSLFPDTGQLTMVMAIKNIIFLFLVHILEFANIFLETAFFPLFMVGRFDVSIIPLFGEFCVILFAFIAGVGNDTGILEREMLAEIFEERQQGGTI